MTFILPHSSIDFKKNEIRTLEIIFTRGFFDNDFNSLASSINATYQKYRGTGHNKLKDLQFDFESDFEIKIEKKIHRVVLHALVKGNYEMTTYSLAICKKKDSTELIRRFHFDYAHKTGGQRQRVPVCHLQYCGTTGSSKFSSKKLYEWLSEPRLNFPPINIALLLDIVFTEFKNEKTVTISESPEWRNLIKENEIFLLKDYYKLISTHIDSPRHNKETLIRDICYI